MGDEERERRRSDLFGETDPRPHRRWYAGAAMPASFSGAIASTVLD